MGSVSELAQIFTLADVDDEPEFLSETKMSGDIGNHRMWRRLLEKQTNGSVQKSLVKKALTSYQQMKENPEAGEVGWKRPLTDTETADWLANMETRFLLAAGRLKKALRKKEHPKWLQQLMLSNCIDISDDTQASIIAVDEEEEEDNNGVDDEEEEEDNEGIDGQSLDGDSENADEERWVVSFDWTNKMAVRIKGDLLQRRGLDFLTVEDGVVVCTWVNGDRSVVEEVLDEDLQNMRSAENVKNQGRIWEIETGDRQLYVLNPKGGYRFMIKAKDKKAYQNGQVLEKDFDNKQDCYNFVASLVDAVADGTVTVEGLKEEKNRRLGELQKQKPIAEPPQKKRKSGIAAQPTEPPPESPGLDDLALPLPPFMTFGTGCRSDSEESD